jgi:glucose-6-phosphate isomerase
LDAYSRACDRLDALHFVDALRARRTDIWTPDPAIQEKIAHRLGWVEALAFVTPHVPRLKAFAASIRDAGFTDVVLLGMGGSSLAPEVIRRVLGVADGFPRFRMLDSVDPEAVRDAMSAAATSLFVLASKSGSTIEPNVMAAEAIRQVLASGHPHHGPRFVAITDDATALHRRAVEERFREVFVNPADIGGRYSALSFFGLVPASLMGVDLERLLQGARDMETACLTTRAAENPALTLGALMAAGALRGRDKLTLLLPDPLSSLGLWVEQLVAESTGKLGKGVVPITGEEAAAYGDDRVAVIVSCGTQSAPAVQRQLAETARLPSITLTMPEAAALGGEFLRWEVATAAAGLLLDINPFDEPNVQQAKDATRALLQQYERQRMLPMPSPQGSIAGMALTASSAAEQASAGEPAEAFLRLIQPGDYFCLLAYLPPDDASYAAPLADLRRQVGARCGCATMFGYGPRYLHSTGQLHKGGANNGVFLVLTATATRDLDIPGEPFTFGVLELAQGVGDFQSLERTGRRALHVHLPHRDPALIARLTSALLAAR